MTGRRRGIASGTQIPRPEDHGYPFDPTYGYGLAELLAVEPPTAPDDLAAFWGGHYDAATRIDPKPRVQRSAFRHPDWHALDLRYTSTDGVPIGGWLLLPRDHPVERALVVGHGYGGREEPDTHLPVDATALLFPCFRGLSRSARPPISQDPNWHVLHDIDRRERYVLRGCVEDLWLAVSVLLALFPWVEGRIGYAGISFGGGIGGLALAWDTRIARGHLSLPTFGHHPLRVTLPTTGSGEAVRRYHAANPDVLDTLAYYDAAAAARHITRPMHIAAACFDPAVPPPGQFAIYNAVAGRKQLFTFSAGHFDYPAAQQEERVLLSQLRGFFAEL